MHVDIAIIIFVLLGSRDIIYSFNGIEKSFIWIIWSFCLGYRTLRITSWLYFHPIEIFSLMAILRIITTNYDKKNIMPTIHKVTFFMFLLVFISGFQNFGVVSFNEFKSISIFYQLFFISQYIEFKKATFYRMMESYLIPAFHISFFGVVEFIFPAITSAIFQNSVSNVQNPIIPDVSSILFNRVGFLFWGTHLAANLISPVFPILIYLKLKKHWLTQRFFILSATIILFLIAIYLSGNRISWLILTCMLLILLIFFSNARMSKLKSYSIYIIGLFVFMVYSLPATRRYISIFQSLTFNIDASYDASSSKRLKFIKYGLEVIQDNFFGVGWGKLMWFHSDFIQIVAATGVIPGILFILSILFFMIKVFRYFKHTRRHTKLSETNIEIFLVLNFAVFIAISLAMNGNYALVQTGAPIFILWVISENYVNYSIKSQNKKRVIK